MTEKEISVEIQAGFAVDKGKGIARLDKDSMRRLELSPGDIIEIQGLRKTYSKCLTGPEKEQTHGIINIDRLICSNAGIGIGSRIYVKKIFATAAKKIVIAPLEITPFDDESEIKEALTWFPVIQGDNVVFENFDGNSFFRIIQTIPPDSAVVVTSKTDLEIKEYLFLKENKKLDEPEKNFNDEFTEEEFLQIKRNYEK